MTSQETIDARREEFSKLINEALSQKGLSPEDVASITRISSPAIKDLVDGNLEAFATPVVARGFIRSLSRVVGLDASRMVDLYNATIDVAAKEVLRPLKGVGGQVGPKDSLRVRMIEEVLSFKPVRKFAWRRVLPKNMKAVTTGILFVLLAVGLWYSAVWIKDSLWVRTPVKAKAKPIATIEEIPRGIVPGLSSAQSASSDSATATSKKEEKIQNSVNAAMEPVSKKPEGTVPVAPVAIDSVPKGVAELPSKIANTSALPETQPERTKAFGGMMEAPEAVPNLTIDGQSQ